MKYPSKLGNFQKFITIFTVFGFYELNCLQKLRQIFYLANISTISAIILYVVFRLKTIISLVSPVSSFNDTIQMSSVTLSVIVILVQSIRRRKSFGKILQNFQQIDCLFDANLFRHSRDYTVQFIALVVYTIVVEANTYIEVRVKEEEWARFWTLNIYQLTITRLWYLHHLMYMNCLRKRLALIDQQLEQIFHKSQYGGDHNHLQEEMRKLKMAYNLAWNSMWHMNKIFGITQMLNFGQCFIEFVAEFYWIYLYYVYEPKNIYATGYVWTPTLFCIFLLLSEANQVGKIQDKIIANINQIYRLRWNRWLLKMSYQMLRNKIYFHAANFFVLDYSLIQSMLSSLSIYLVIIIQFIPKKG